VKGASLSFSNSLIPGCSGGTYDPLDPVLSDVASDKTFLIISFIFIKNISIIINIKDIRKMEDGNQETYGNLFGTINLLTEEHLDVILSTMNKDYCIYYLVEAVKAAHKRGAYTIGESEVISKSIRVLSKEE